ncbi:MAG: Mg2 transporter protein CorA family protein, metal ion transporter, MIT family [Candidatus Moranbacteria bacterium GW2011_GWC1_45_18]|nr:MAG: Mg2 transporter protein CorA family protein [Candidatus Moranbacteria bacterium GW2011_GWC2_40_12]KKT33902.1 MAG: Mg2 transporter protein CorA family protein [Candidatus Moranbacteria bacterium GW2011_GWF2_44_10]KKT72260.1 MAG: Mg2 transporter protein CorA family protein [Candidatus Moranbacteria bacterium GW2011_GWF1_44_4]KKT99802.1 MAG: Mg2 transporter protein CorA family protein, metal ion transporter, MIT family [Candidatus Moranbacteria bacterium GW2011_GWC1_45_18]OGI24108.1 MAG: h
MREVSSQKITWIDFTEPSADEILFLKKLKLHPLALEEFSTPSARPKASLYGNCLYLTLHIPLFDKLNRRTFPSELDIVMTKSHLITGHDQDIFQLREFFGKLKRNKKIQAKYMSQSPGYLLYYIIEMLLESCFPKIDHINKNLDNIEEQIFKGHEREMVHEISYVKRDILNFRRTLKPQKSVLESLARDNYPLLEADLKTYYQDLIGTNIRVWSALENAKEVVESLEETNDALLSNKLNTTMKVLTVFSGVMLPMMVISNTLAMSANIPFGHNPHAYWIWMGIMAIISLVTVGIFKWKNWI